MILYSVTSEAYLYKVHASLHPENPKLGTNFGSLDIEQKSGYQTNFLIV